MKLSRCVLLTAACLAALPAWGNGIAKLGFIDTARVFSQSVHAAAIETVLQNEFRSRQEAVQALRTEIVRLRERLGGQRLNAEEHQRTARELAAAEARLATENTRLVDEYNLRRQEEFAALQHQANLVIETIARRGGYELILSDGVIYVDTKYDITDEVIRELNRR